MWKYEINHTVASASFYIVGKGNGILSPIAFSRLTRACSGGEPFTKSNVIQINQWLKDNGCDEKIAIGGGAGEEGASVLTSYEMNSKTKTNETGRPIPGTFVKIVNPITGEIVSKGERGIIHMSSAASADRYLDNDKATDEYFYTDSDGIRWGILGDIAVQNEDDSYSMLGRASDSYINENEEITYLFDIEYSLDVNDPILEWEISAFKVPDSNFEKVAQVVLKKEYDGLKSDIVKLICEKYKLDAVKFYDSFGVSEVTGKRDYLSLKNDRIGYYAPYDEKNF